MHCHCGIVTVLNRIEPCYFDIVMIHKLNDYGYNECYNVIGEVESKHDMCIGLAIVIGIFHAHE